MPYHDTRKPRPRPRQPLRPNQTEPQGEPTEPQHDLNGNGNVGENPIVSASLYAEEQDGWTYIISGEPYIGDYHQHQDGTYMIGAGEVGISHEINLDEEIEQSLTMTGLGDIDIPPEDASIETSIPEEVTILIVREIVTDIFYKKFFESNTLTEEQILSVQTTIRDGYPQTGRAEDEQLVFYKKDRNTLESQDDLQGQSFDDIVQYIYDNDLLSVNNLDDSVEVISNNFTLEEYDYKGIIPEELLSMEDLGSLELRNYDIKYSPQNDLSFTITIATEVVEWVNDELQPLANPYFTDALNLSQIVKPKIGNKINPQKASEVLDTNIFELLPTQTTRQDQINDFFNEFNDLIGQTPPYEDIDNDGVGENIPEELFNQDEENRISYENKSTAYITRLDSQANSNNQGKTLESMRNQLNTYLGDVDNVVQVISDQRPEYENKSRGFLKIRKPNQAIILRNPNQELEFQKDNSYLTDGFTITMWVRFVGKTGRGTLFNFGNPISTESPYGFRLETITRKDTQGQYKRIVRLVVRDHLQEKLYDSSFGGPTRDRYNTIENDELAFGGTRNNRFNDYVKVPTDDLNEWFFICATYDPTIDEEGSFEEPYNSLFNRNKQFWLNHIEPEFSAAGMEDFLVANSGFGARCKVEIISRSDLLRARGFKVGSLEYDV
jgi:hypothetical protein